MSNSFSRSEAPEKEISTVCFGIMSPENIESRSVALIEHVEMFENKKPKIGGLSDPRLGCIERHMFCQTCSGTINDCPGHFGHIMLNVPVYHIGFIKVVKKILECVCHKCARFRLLTTDHRYKKLTHVKNKFAYSWEYAKSKNVCEYSDCEAQLLPLRRNGFSLYYDPKKLGQKMNRIPLSALDARKILERISDETCILIGLDPINSRPEWMITTVLPVPPPCIRPSVTIDGSGRGEDDLTHMLTNIIRYNALVQKFENSRRIGDYIEQLQYHITTYMDNDVSGIQPALQKGGRPVKSITARLKGKEGRIRGNLMGKRVDFSARTVITGDPNISIEEVGVPKSIAQNLTFPDTATNFNIEKLQKLVDNGSNYPGAKYVIKESGQRIDLRHASKKPEISVGDVVERHIITGDIVLFNRQPSLHKMSMMAHRAKIMENATFRLNVNVCASYNADFDGDEMNLHAPQAYAAAAELETLSTVSKLLVSSQANKPVNALVQDSLNGIRIFTKRDTFLTKDQVMNLVLWIKDFDGGLPIPAILKPVPLWTGKQIISMFLPKIHLVGYHSKHPENEKTDISPGDTKVYIFDGELVSGIICKRTIGTSSGGILHIIFNDCGPDQARDFLDNTAQVVNQWVLHYGFSVGIGDVCIRKNTSIRIDSTVDSIFKEVGQVMQSFNSGSMKSQGNLTLDETKENKVRDLLSKARDQSGKITQSSILPCNNVQQMIESGSKGSSLNICQMSACVGQQIVEGNRIPFGFSGRSLPHYQRYDDRPESRGFVRNSFIRGLTPQELYFHAMGGREGIIDTAVKTAETGYIQRRLVKSLEDVSTKYDGTVRNSRGDIIQYIYGEDGFDGVVIENQTFDTMLLSDAEFFKRYYNKNLPEEWEQLSIDRLFLRENLRLADDKWPIPLNVKRLLITVKRNFEKKTDRINGKSNVLTAKYIFSEIMTLRQTLRPSKFFSSHDINPNQLFSIQLQSVFASKMVLEKHKLQKDCFDFIMSQIKKKYYSGIVSPGECVGVIAAQSIGEPATQMTLNTFHSSGTGNKMVTAGIPRLKELINAAKTLKTPGMTIYLQENIRFSKKDAYIIKTQIEHTLLISLVETTEIIYDPDYINSIVEKDRIWLNIQTQIPDEDMPTAENLYPWLLRIIINRKMLLEKDISMKNISDKIYETLGDDIFEMHSDDNSKELVFHLRMFKDEENLENETQEPLSGNVFFEINMIDILNSVSICGIPGVKKAFVSEKPVDIYGPDGDLLKNQKEFVIETDGINMKDVINVFGIDPTKLTCNNPQEMAEMFGIEVARQTLMQEIRGVIEDGGTYINYRHLVLLCEIMTHKGQIMSITRHGINKTEAGPLMKCSFEQTVDILMDAAINGEKDNVTGVTEHLILGKVAPIGTGMMEILLDTELLDTMKIQKNIPHVSQKRKLENDDYNNFNNGNVMKTLVTERLLNDSVTETYSPLKPSYL